MTIIERLLPLIAVVNPRLALQLKDRSSVAALSQQIAPARAKFRYSVVFYCSSAGEFEQAKPLISRIQALGNTYVHVIFFSRSGVDYARARGENVPYSLAPLTDSIWQWGWLFSALLPTITCVVRHELWPGFLAIAGRFGKLYLLDASQSLGESRSRLWGFLRGILLRRFDGIFAVSDADRQFFVNHYRLSAAKITATSDTKYDRVIERARSKPEMVENLRQLFDSCMPSGTHARMVLGSAYFDEVDVLLDAWRKRPPGAPEWQIIVVPHMLSPAYLDGLSTRIAAAGHWPERYSILRDKPQKCSVILVDTMGMLAEIYGTASAALVGGALHHQVHNALEPASHGLAIAFGPFYKNSQEAIHLVNAGLVSVVSNADQLGAWWSRLDADPQAMRQSMLGAIHELTGASDQVIAEWRPLLGDP